ncbi:MAG: GNAT family N-acetyltransferase [Pseudomonadota bacterium]
MDIYAQTGVMTVPTLRTERLTLRTPRLRDARVIAKALNNIGISRWLAVVPFPYGITDAEWFIKENLHGRVHAWLAWRDDQLIGIIGLDSELGYWIAEDVWGYGYATEATRAVVDYHFENSDADRLKSAHFVGNDASRRVLTKLGFVDVGSHVRFSVARQEEVSGRSMLLTRAKWQAAQ